MCRHEDAGCSITCTLSVRKNGKRSYPASGDGLFRRGVATLRTSTGIAFRAAMRRLLAVDVVNHVMRQRYNALEIGSVFHDI